MLHSWPSYIIVLTVGRNFFLIQFMRSYDHLFDDAISCILLSKNICLTLQIVDLKAFQLGNSPSS